VNAITETLAGTPSLAALTELPAAPRGEMRQLALAGKMRFILSFNETREYVDALHVTRVPRSPPWLLGVFGSDGLAVPLVDIEAWAQNAAPVASSSNALGGAAKPRHHALRMGDGLAAWAISLSQAPSVVDLGQAQSQEVSTRLPMSVSSANGRLMAHAAQIWTLADGAMVAQIRWPEVAQTLRQELSGLSAN
jgi:CheW-like domain